MSPYQHQSKRILFFGVKEVGARALKTLFENNLSICGVITMPGEANREIRERAKGLGLTPIEEPGLKRASIRRRILEQCGPDYALCFSYPRIICREFLEALPAGCINFHPAKLPEYRGCYPTVWPVLNGDQVAVYTAHQMDADIDTGPIVDIWETPVSPGETGWSLYSKLVRALPAFLERLMPMLREGRFPAHVQDESRAAYYSSDQLQKLNRVDFCQPSVVVDRLVRALYHPRFKGAIGEVGGRVIELFACERMAETSAFPVKPGGIVESEEGVLVRCGEGWIVLREIGIGDGRRLASTAEIVSLLTKAEK